MSSNSLSSIAERLRSRRRSCKGKNDSSSQKGVSISVDLSDQRINRTSSSKDSERTNQSKKSRSKGKSKVSRRKDDLICLGDSRSSDEDVMEPKHNAVKIVSPTKRSALKENKSHDSSEEDSKETEEDGFPLEKTITQQPERVKTQNADVTGFQAKKPAAKGKGHKIGRKENKLSASGCRKSSKRAESPSSSGSETDDEPSSSSDSGYDDESDVDFKIDSANSTASLGFDAAESEDEYFTSEDGEDICGTVNKSLMNFGNTAKTNEACPSKINEPQPVEWSFEHAEEVNSSVKEVDPSLDDDQHRDQKTKNSAAEHISGLPKEEEVSASKEDTRNSIAANRQIHDVRVEDDGIMQQSAVKMPRTRDASTQTCEEHNVKTENHKCATSSEYVGHGLTGKHPRDEEVIGNDEEQANKRRKVPTRKSTRTATMNQDTDLGSKENNTSQQQKGISSLNSPKIPDSSIQSNNNECRNGSSKPIDRAMHNGGASHPKSQRMHDSLPHACKENNETEIDDKTNKINSDLDASDAFGGEEASDKAKGTEQPTERIKVFRRENQGLHKVLLNAILDENMGLEEENIEAERPPVPENSLPLKFRFEDEVPKQVEKTEDEKRVDSLFAEMERLLILGDMGSLDNPEVKKRKVNETVVEETQQQKCAKGNHYLVMRDDIGLRCLYCTHIECHARDVLPPWAERTIRDVKGNRASGAEQHLTLDGLDFKSSENYPPDFSKYTAGTVWDLKPHIRDSMYEHQKEGFEFLWKNIAGSTDLAELNKPDVSDVGGCIISHAPGTGKTRLTIVFIETYLKVFPGAQPVIIAPASMLLTWEEEFKKWNVEFPFHNLNNLEFSGKESKAALELLPDRRQHQDAIRMVKIYSWTKGRSVLGVSYSLYEKLVGQKYSKEKGSKKQKRTVRDRDSESLRKIFLEKPGLVVLDEGHTPRNKRSSIWNSLLELQTKKRVILSGTPFQNNFGELFNTLRLVRPSVAESLAKGKTFSEVVRPRKSLKGLYINEAPASKSAVETESVKNAISNLKSVMAPFVHVHKGSILRQSLPGLKDCVVLLNPPPLQKSIIEKIQGSQSTFEFEYKVALVSVHPYLYCCLKEDNKSGISQDALVSSRLDPNEGVKTKFIMELVRLSVTDNEKVLIFSQYIEPLKLIKDQMGSLFSWREGKQVFMMRGKMDQKQRQTLINAFNDPDSEAKVLLASTRCCSEGINLVGASRVVLLDVVWNPSVERQAISRAYRLGQKKIVYTYHLMTSGTTEGDKYCRQAEKDRLSELVFTSSKERDKPDNCAPAFEDGILQDMVSHARLKDMFEKIINQPKEANLIETFGVTST